MWWSPIVSSLSFVSVIRRKTTGPGYSLGCYSLDDTVRLVSGDLSLIYTVLPGETFGNTVVGEGRKVNRMRVGYWDGWIVQPKDNSPVVRDLCS